jgi:D-alanyl-D-alanine carboxypeptidase
MITLFTTLISFLTGGLPSLLGFFQDKSDKKHELELARLQTERELELLEKGYAAQAHVEEIRTQQVEMQTQVQERQSLYAHDIEISKGAAQWVINSRAMVRPAITYGLFLMFAFVEVFGFWFAFHKDVPFDVALNLLWDDETQIIWASVVSFWFGTQAFKK